MSDLPPHTLATHGVPTRHGFQAGSPVLVIQYIHSVQSSQQPLRLRADDIATNRRLLCPRLRTAGPRLPRQGQALSAPALPGSLPHSVARHAWRSDPERPLRAPTPRRFPSETSHACGGRSARAETPIRHRSAREGNSGGLTPPPWVPRRRAVETSATSAERRRRPGRGWFYMQSSQVKSSQVKSSQVSYFTPAKHK